METKANTALIGAFTLVVLALGFVFIYWLARGSDQGATAPLAVVFEDPVTGLSVGSQVLFNGIKVGDVKTLELDPENPKVVVAGLAVEPLRSIKADTQVTLGFQGLTGVGYVEMAGGSPGAPPIWESMPEPTITAARSSMQDLLAGARTILARTDETLQSLEKVVSDNTDDIAKAVNDVQTFTGALAANADNVEALLENVSAAASGIAEATAKLDGIVQKSEALLTSVDPEQVRSTLGNVLTMTDNLAQQSQNLSGIVQRAEAITTDIQGFSKTLPALGARTEALVAAIDPATVGSTLERLSQIAAAVDPEQVRTTVAGVSSLAEVLQGNQENIGSIVTQMTALSRDLAGFATNLPAVGEKASTLLAAINPEQVGKTLDNLNQFSTALAGSADDIDAIVADARAVSGRFNTLSTRAESLMAKLDSMAGAGSGGIMEDAKATLAAVREAADSFNAQVTVLGSGLGDFSDRGLRDVQSLVSEGQKTISRLDRVISDLEQNPSGFLLGGERVPEYGGRRR
jgi:phospholipid/cholesterol/gamma-HCH transport system substrate-binding protein